MEDQTNNRIREVYRTGDLKDWENLTAELLKSQRDSIVERIEKAMPSHDAVQKELSLIKEQ